MTRAEVESAKRIIAHLRKDAAHIERSPWKLAKGRAATRRRWADLVARMLRVAQKSKRKCKLTKKEAK